jgi:hypothetical protein
MKKIDEIIQLVREEIMTANSPGQSGGFSELSPKEGPTAGYTQPMFGLPVRRNGKLDMRNPFIKKYKMILTSLGLVSNK